ncbi:hypothetical protein acsn021_42910 [Anaerocolumna cellulosilytica]|uniref:Uncharacterized protein n=1 Tax=Anaerocolumna cellulosilytica TaxID=433286 RepID=A0A6S6RBX8_9FIRM|nr:glycosyl hydrolase family 18 protein [Anaerocolumna cellulosilytica]MBB5195249.1 spore germination protein YaaH [Anaerocolumna cellulosilytica]BCJ96722.1 hypothetical protein acsn021_42910 [Anaerocolumna cellulosilytica]
MKRQAKQAVIGTTIALLIIIIAVGAALISKFTPSKKSMELTDYYQVSEEEAFVIMQDSIYEKKALIEDSTIYLDYDTVTAMFNKRFYWDAKENVLSYTTPSEIIRAELGGNSYLVNKSKKETSYTIVKVKNSTVYIAIEFVKEFSDLEYELYKEPNRLVIQYDWGDYLFTTVKKTTQLRYEDSIKSDILVELVPGQVLTYVDTSEVAKNNFSKVMTEDGVIGYVRNKHVAESYYETLISDFEAPEYTHISKDKKINLVWHQVTNRDANNNLLNLLEKTKGVNVVSPTWFKITDNEGNISSLADTSYVDRAHNYGVEVWGLVDDFSTEVDMGELLSYTSKREKLMNELVAEAIKYNLDGINIDFEKIPSAAGLSYIQFIRELSVKCRSNGIVLSVDNYVPTSYSAYYDREEQGIVADYVIIMAYDEHHGGSDVSGPVSSLSFVEGAVKNTLAMVPKERIIMALPFYTRQWKEVTEKDGAVTVTSEAFGMSSAERVLKENGVEAAWDENVGLYYGEYKKDNALYRIWLEEEDSFEEKLKVVTQADVAGIAGWKLGLEKENIWNIIVKYIN